MSNVIFITIIDRKGEKHTVEAPTDMNMNLMELCKSYDIPVEGTCGGMALCASCQVYILSEQVPLTRNENEQAMLDEAYNVKSNSRLGCQIQLSKTLNGLVVELAPEAPKQTEEDDW
ncbi:MAG: 2Fe-2S iron-sulfur cluster-binding protein [Flavobacteriales bacterium]